MFLICATVVFPIIFLVLQLYCEMEMHLVQLYHFYYTEALYFCSTLFYNQLLKSSSCDKDTLMSPFVILSCKADWSRS